MRWTQCKVNPSLFSFSLILQIRTTKFPTPDNSSKIQTICTFNLHISYIFLYVACYSLIKTHFAELKFLFCYKFGGDGGWILHPLQLLLFPASLLEQDTEDETYQD